MKRAHLLIVMCAAAATAIASAVSASDRTSHHLFFIARSRNANVVMYDVNTRDGRALDRDDPLSVYWILEAEDGRREGLSWIERQLAYGFEILGHARARGFKVRIAAFDRRSLRVRFAEGRWQAEVPIANVRAFLDKVYVKSEDAGMVPKVHYVDLHGRRVDDGRPVTERITEP